MTITPRPIRTYDDLPEAHRPRPYVRLLDGQWIKQWNWYHPQITLALAVETVEATGGSRAEARTSGQYMSWTTQPSTEEIAEAERRIADNELRQRQGRFHAMEKFATEFGYHLTPKEEA